MTLPVLHVSVTAPVSAPDLLTILARIDANRGCDELQNADDVRVGYVIVT